MLQCLIGEIPFKGCGVLTPLPTRSRDSLLSLLSPLYVMYIYIYVYIYIYMIYMCCNV